MRSPHVITSLLDITRRILGARCLVCIEPGHAGNICQTCRDNLPKNDLACYYCANPLPHGQRCGKCLTPKNQRTIAPFHYVRPLDLIIYQLKFKPSRNHARLCGTLLAQTLPLHYRYEALPEVIIPVPLSAMRLKQRGFNQAEEIAKPVANQLNIPIDKNLCRRIRNTQPQATLTQTERIKNIKQAFMVVPNAYRHIAIIDDVVTTGLTVNELAKTCWQTGIQQIDIWSVARAT